MATRALPRRGFSRAEQAATSGGARRACAEGRRASRRRSRRPVDGGRRPRIDLPLIRASVLDSPEATAARLLEHRVTGIVHLAAKKSVPESMYKPLHYYEINVVGTLRLMEGAVLAGVTQLIYSSSAAVYGPAPARPVTEDNETDPASPYGETKLAAEWIVRRTAHANAMIWTALRDSNVAGCANGVRAEHAATNLIPRAISHIMRGKPVPVFGGLADRGRLQHTRLSARRGPGSRSLRRCASHGKHRSRRWRAECGPWTWRECAQSSRSHRAAVEPERGKGDYQPPPR